jgi:ferredoxin-NADP reductase
VINKPQKYTAEVMKNKQVNERDYIVDLKLLAPNEISFTPGQFVSMTVAENTNRAYSICSDPKQTHFIAITVTILEDGVGSEFIKNLIAGDTVEFIGPSGRFHLTKPYSEEILFVCTGAGIAPFIPMLTQLRDDNCMSKMKLYFGVRNMNQLLFMDFLEDCKSNLADFKYEICLSRENGRHDKNDGYVTEYFKIDDVAIAHIYVCGHPEMINDMTQKLSELGVPNEHIFTEKFTVVGKN